MIASAVVAGLGEALTGAVGYGLLNDVVAADGYLIGRSVLNMSVGAMQIGGFAVGDRRYPTRSRSEIRCS